MNYEAWIDGWNAQRSGYERKVRGKYEEKEWLRGYDDAKRNERLNLRLQDTTADGPRHGRIRQ